MSNSSLVSYTKLSPNHSGKRTMAIDRITPHCVVGQCTISGLGEWFARSSTQASSNYGIDKDGKVGLFVDEGNRSWCSSSNANDQRAITIECASDTSEPYAFRSVVYQRLIDLCTDICKRNGKTKLLWVPDKNTALNYFPKSNEMVLTVHRWFADKSCPGNWLYSRMSNLASAVTARLARDEESDPPIPTPNDQQAIKVGDVVKIVVDGDTAATYYNGQAIPGWVASTLWIVRAVSGDRVVIDKSVTGNHAICSPIASRFLQVVTSAAEKPFAQYLVRVTASVLNIRSGPGTDNSSVGAIYDKGVYTIVAEADGKGATRWGRLKSGVGWISLDYTTRI